MKFFALAALLAYVSADQTMMMSDVTINMAMINVDNEDDAKDMMENIMASSIFA